MAAVSARSPSPLIMDTLAAYLVDDRAERESLELLI